MNGVSVPQSQNPPTGIRRVAGGVSLYTLALVASGGIRMLALPFIVRLVSPSVYGAFATLTIVVWMVQSFGDLGLGTAALRLAPDCKTPSERRSLFATMLSTRAGAGLLLTGVVILAHEPLARWVSGSSDNGRALVCLALCVPFATVYEGFTDELRSRGEMAKVSALVVLLAVLVQGLSVALVLGGGLDLLGLAWARVVGEALTFGAGAVLCVRFVRARPNLPDFQRLLALGWPIGAMYVLGTLRGLDRPLMRTLTSLEHVAAYEFAMRLVGPIGLSNIALAKVLEPVVYGRAHVSETPAHVDMFLRGYVALFATVAMALSAFGPEAVTLLAPKAYGEAFRVLPALAFLATSEGIGRVVGVGADLAKRMRVWAVAAVLTVAIGLPLSAGLLPIVGVAGVGLAWLAASLATDALLYAVARSLRGIVLPVGRSFAVIVVGALAGTAAAWQPWPLAARSALLVAYGVAAWYVMGVSVREFKATWSRERAGSG
jgi:O-antigen/teichoic acid export membrane protein